MAYIRKHLPVLVAAALMAVTSTAWLGRQHILSRFFAAGQLAAAADMVFFLFTLLYAGLLWQARQRLAPRRFYWGLGALIMVNLLILLL